MDTVDCSSRTGVPLDQILSNFDKLRPFKSMLWSPLSLDSDEPRQKAQPSSGTALADPIAMLITVHDAATPASLLYTPSHLAPPASCAIESSFRLHSTALNSHVCAVPIPTG